MTDVAALNYLWAWHLLDGLAVAGLGRVVVSPGSRSTPLALAALRHPGLTVDMVIDERSAGFFALGAAKAGGKPVALVATSGSAVANWMPAVVEADMARVPLILLSADRPPELQDRGANQTMEQPGLFGVHVRACHVLPPAAAGSEGWLAELGARAVATSLGPLPGPVHLNLPFREPLVPAAPLAPPPRPAAPRRLSSASHPDPASLGFLRDTLSSGAGAIVCGAEDLGDGFRTAVLDLAGRLKVPVLADILSGLRFGPGAGGAVLAHPDQVARKAPPADWVLRFGGTPVSRPLAEWLGRCSGRPQVVVSGHPRFADAPATATHSLHADPAALCRSIDAAPAPGSWLAGFVARDHAAGAAADRVCAGPEPFEGGFFRTLLPALPDGTPVFFGNSLTVRSADWFAGRVPRRLRPFGNRGLSGIDGNLSTAFGIAAVLGPTVAVVGDLAFLHDLNALALNAAAPLVAVVLDNGGGGIFDHLAQADLPEFETGWLTPQKLAVADACRAFALPCRPAAGIGEAVGAVLTGLAGSRAAVVNLPVSREVGLSQVRAFHSACGEGA